MPPMPEKDQCALAGGCSILPSERYAAPAAIIAKLHVRLTVSKKRSLSKIVFAAGREFSEEACSLQYNALRMGRTRPVHAVNVAGGIQQTPAQHLQPQSLRP